MQRFLRRVAVIGGARIPFCRSNTFYADLSNLEMMTGALNALVDRYNLKGQHIDEVIGRRRRHALQGLQPDARGGARHEPRAVHARHHHHAGVRHQPAGRAGHRRPRSRRAKSKARIAVGSDTTSDAPIVVSKKLAQRLTKASLQKTTLDKLKVFKGFSPGELVPEPPSVDRAAHRAVDGRARRADGAGVGHHARRAGRLRAREPPQGGGGLSHRATWTIW